MRRRRTTWILSVLLVMAFGLTAAGVAHAYLVPALEQRLTAAPGDQSFPAIDGAQVVYQDHRNGNLDIYRYDLSTGLEHRLTTSVQDQRYPNVSGTKVVYEDARNGNWDIYCYDIETGMETRLTTNTANQISPAISGTNVVYEDNRNGNPDVYCYDLIAGRERAVTTGTAAQGSPDIDGNRIVYEDSTSGTRDIFCYDLAAGVAQPVVTAAGNQARPRVSGNKVVYQDNRDGVWEVYLHFIGGTVERRLTSNLEDDSWPDISGTKVVYERVHAGNLDIYCLDLGTGVEHRLTTDPARQSGAAIFGATVVYADERDGDWNIYMAELAAPRIVAAAPSVVGYSKSATVRGSLSTVGGIPMAGRWLGLTISADGVDWTLCASGTTDADGTFAIMSPKLPSAAYLQVTFVGEASGYMSSQSEPLRVKPKASLGTPVAASSMRRTRTYSVYGRLAPRHPVGSAVGLLQCFRLEGNKRVLRKSVTIKASDYTTPSRYQARVRLPIVGKWYLRAWHEDAGHALTLSGWRYVRVR